MNNSKIQNLSTIALALFWIGIPSSVLAGPITLFEGFEDDFLAGRSVPDLVDSSLSSPFGIINEKRPSASGKPVLRDRDVDTPGGEGGGFLPIENVRLDFTDGLGSFVTFQFSSGGLPIAGGSISFDVNVGSDGGSLFKSISSDGINFTSVGDSSDANGTYTFDLATGAPETFFRLQVGTAAGIFEGLHVDNFSATIQPVSEPSTYILLGTGFLGIFGYAWRRRS